MHLATTLVSINLSENICNFVDSRIKRSHPVDRAKPGDRAKLAGCTHKLVIKGYYCTLQHRYRLDLMCRRCCRRVPPREKRKRKYLRVLGLYRIFRLRHGVFIKSFPDPEPNPICASIHPGYRTTTSFLIYVDIFRMGDSFIRLIIGSGLFLKTCFLFYF